MSEQDWYSASLRFYTVTSTEGWIDSSESVYLVRAGDFKEAFQRFLAIGRRAEQSYKNGYGHDVRLRFVAIVTLDMVQLVDGHLDGAEVYAGGGPQDVKDFSFDTPVDPSLSRPGYTGI